jgi:hypothetical protein
MTLSTASQFVIEEKILGQYSIPPLLAVGYEGLFGTISVLALLPLLALIKLSPSSPAAPWFDLVRGWHQLVDTPSVLYSGIIVAISISLFNFFGLSVTKYVSATARSLTDTCRTLAIWIVSLMLGWEILMWPISLLQVAGFGLLVYGTVRGQLPAIPSILRNSPWDSVLVQQPSATTALPASIGGSYFGCRCWGGGRGRGASVRGCVGRDRALAR